MIQAKLSQSKNALNQLSLDIIALADQMIKEINKCVKDNLSYIKEQKSKIERFILGHIKDPCNDIINWANSLKLHQRNKNNFIQVGLNLLNIKANNFIGEPISTCNIKFDEDNTSQYIQTCDE